MIYLEDWKRWYKMTNLEKLRTGTDEEVLHLMQRFAYRSLSYTYQELQTEEFLQEECHVNYKGEAIKQEGKRIKILKNKVNKIKAKLIVEVEGKFYDNESSEETLRYCVEQDLEDAGFNIIDVSVMK